MGQSSSSLVLSVIKTEVPLDCDDRVNQDLLLQQYGERFEKLSQQDKLSKFCMDAGFLNVVEIGQYFRTKDTAEFSQFHAVACREYTSKRIRSITIKRMDVSKKVLYLLRHSQHVHREEDGAVQFWRIKESLQNQFTHSPHWSWSYSKWKVCLAGGGGNKRQFQYCTDYSGTIVYFRALQGHSGRNLIESFITGQCDNSVWIIPSYLPCRMCF